MKKVFLIILSAMFLTVSFSSCREKNKTTETEEIIEEMKEDGAEVKVKTDDDETKIKMETEDKEVKIKTEGDETEVKIETDN
jgi:ABC-type enterochelin transport system substrate-binding protein